MAYTGRISERQRIAAGGATLLVLVATGIMLVNGLDLSVARRASEAISAIAIPAPPPPREQPKPTRHADDTPNGAASAANIKARAAPVFAPEPDVPPPEPPQIAAAPKPGSGSEASAGAAPRPGPGSGAGGRGDGLGAVGSGSGTGGGTRPAWISGRIKDSDYPRAASRAKIGGEVEVRFTVEPDGRAAHCRITRSSGDAALDATTCRLIEARFRFKPATDGSGHAIASDYGWRQRWWLEPPR